MGPPKKKPFRVKFDEIKRRENYFEYRWNSTEGHYYFFNPYTGETIPNAEGEHIDRDRSMFAKPEREQDVSKDAHGIVMLSAIFRSRIWGVRKFFGWNGDRDGAARSIQAAARGHMARCAMRQYLRERYYTILCPFTHYYYFLDTHYPKRDTTWFKPYLATPGLIQPFKPFDPTDNMPSQGDKYTYRGFVKGPYLRQAKIGKANTARAPQDAFQIVDPRRALALRSNEDIDLDKYPMGSVVLWMDDLRLESFRVDDYQAVRTCIVGNDWGRTLDFMKDNWDRVLVRCYGWHSFSKTEVPLEGKLLTAEAKEVLNLAWYCLEDKEGKFGTTEKCFIGAAFASILSIRSSRLEYFDASYVKEQGEARQAAVDAFVAERCSKFNRYLSFIPTELIKASIKGSKDFYEERVPELKNMVLIETILDILALLGHDSEQKEALATNTVGTIYYALKVCAENGTLVMSGLRCLYNFIYRCESAQELVLVGDTLNTFARVRKHHSADPQIMQQLRRLELACKKDNWRGNVESLMDLEMQGKRIPRSQLQTSPYQREYPEWYKFPLEAAEESRLANIAMEEEKQKQLEEEEAAELLAIAALALGDGDTKGQRQPSRPSAGEDDMDMDMGSSVASGSISEVFDAKEGGVGGGGGGGGMEDVMGALAQLKMDLSQMREEHRQEAGAKGEDRKAEAGGYDDDDVDDLGSLGSLGMDSVQALSKDGSEEGRGRGVGGRDAKKDAKKTLTQSATGGRAEAKDAKKSGGSGQAKSSEAKGRSGRSSPKQMGRKSVGFAGSVDRGGDDESSVTSEITYHD